MTLQPAQGGQRFAPGRATTPRKLRKNSVGCDYRVWSIVIGGSTAAGLTVSLPNTALHQKSCWCNRERLLVNAILVTEDWPSDRDKESGVTVQDLTQVVEQEINLIY